MYANVEYNNIMVVMNLYNKYLCEQDVECNGVELQNSTYSLLALQTL